MAVDLAKLLERIQSECYWDFERYNGRALREAGEWWHAAREWEVWVLPREYVPELKDEDLERRFTRGMPVGKASGVQQVFGREEFQAEKDLKNNFVLILGWRWKTVLDWKIALLFRMSGKKVHDGEENVVLQYMQWSDPLDDIKGRVWWVCLWWSTDDEMDYTEEERGWKENKVILQSENGLQCVWSVRLIIVCAKYGAITDFGLSSGDCTGSNSYF